MSPLVEDGRERLLAFVEARDRGSALSLIAELQDSGSDMSTIMRFIASVQVEVGRRWQSGQWSVATEHAATAIAEAMIAAASLVPGGGPPKGQMVVACVEDEWHSLPARMLTEVLRSAGYDITFLGPSVPAEDVGPFIREVDPIGVALSCSVAMNLPGAARTIDAAHAVGARVLAGGRGFGSTAVRASTLGADAWAATPEEAIAIIGTWKDAVDDPVSSSGRKILGEHSALAESRDDVVRAAMAALEQRLPIMAAFDQRQRARTRADYGYIVRFLEAAVLVDDPSIFLDFVEWLQGILLGVGLPETVLPMSLGILASVLPGPMPHSEALLGRAIDDLMRQPAG